MTRPFFSSRGTVPVGAWALLLMLLCPLWEPCDIYYFPWHAGACCEWSQELGAEAAKESGWDSITARAGATWWLNGAALGNLEEHLFFSCFLHLYGLMALYNSWPLHPLREFGGYSFGGVTSAMNCRARTQHTSAHVVARGILGRSWAARCCHWALQLLGRFSAPGSAK